MSRFFSNTRALDRAAAETSTFPRESRLQGYDGLLNSGAFKAGKGINPVKRTPTGVTPAI